jgi:hypothetical protein
LFIFLGWNSWALDPTSTWHSTPHRECDFDTASKNTSKREKAPLIVNTYIYVMFE